MVVEMRVDGSLGFRFYANQKSGLSGTNPFH